MTPVEAEIGQELSTPVRGVSTGVDGFHRIMAAFVMTLCAVLAVLFRIERISLNLLDYSGAAQCAVGLAIVAAYSHWSGYAKMREACLLLFWSFLLVAILPLPQYAAARTAMPLRDGVLVRMDQTIGINIGTVVAWARSHPLLNLFLGQCYHGLVPYVFLAMAILPIAGKFESARRFILAVICGVICASLVVAVFPAASPWSVYHYSLYESQSLIAREFSAIRNPAPFRINTGFSGGLIEFPSFHVALAIMATRALWEFRLFRVPCGLFCLLVAVATMTTGMHYGMDVIGGTVLAIACNAFATSLIRDTARSRVHIRSVADEGLRIALAGR